MIELHTPPHRRVYSYYVCPLLLGDTLVTRRDLKADRVRRTLMLKGAFLEPRQEAGRVAPELVEEPDLMRAWHGIDRIEIGSRGELAAAIRA